MTSSSKPIAARAAVNLHPSSFDQLPDTAMLRLAQLVRSAANPTAPLPISGATVWRKVAAGTFPRPIKLSERVTAWQAGAIRSWLAGTGANGGAA